MNCPLFPINFSILPILRYKVPIQNSIMPIPLSILPISPILAQRILQQAERYQLIP
ncbi:hypothetical protein [Sporosarcina aquimarina]|uniref:hypothetical protein n=1 Tax=Sporosarcina aquimarina TaxID=114975 RepID=UPI00295F302A|nr:hypothetical protein [Sporosarcina aquimarina]